MPIEVPEIVSLVLVLLRAVSDGRIDGDEAADLAARAAVVVDGDDLRALRDRIVQAIDSIDDPRPERLLRRADRLEARAAELRVRALSDAAGVE